jgi:uncharacterized membrane protein
MVVAMWLAGILAGAIHVLIFCMESLWWTTPRVRERFRQLPEQAEATKLSHSIRDSTTCSWPSECSRGSPCF